MKIKLEMDNKKNYNIEWKDTLEVFVQQVQFGQGNIFMLTDSGTYVSINKIVEFTPE